jgi:hypothetical protein
LFLTSLAAAAVFVLIPLQAEAQSTATVTAGGAANDGGADHFTISRDGDSIAVSVNGVAQAPIPLAGLGSLTVQGSSDDDTLTVDESGGLIALSGGITYDGAGGFDSLELGGWTGAPLATTIAPGPTTGGGTVVHSGGGDTQKLVYDNLEPVLDTSAGTLTINGTNGDDAINYTTGTAGDQGIVSVNDLETTEFKNKTSLTLNGNAGSDTINLDYASTTNPAGLTGNINVNGGDPTASDTLILNGIPGVLDNLRNVPSNAGAGTVINDSEPQPNVVYTGIEHVTAVVQSADGDGVRDEGTTGNDGFRFQQGATANTGTFTGTMDKNNNTGVGPFPMVPFTFSGANTTANDTDVNFFNPGGTDTLEFDGTSANDTLGASGGEAGGLQLTDTVNGDVLSRLETFNLSSVSALGLGGDDVFQHSPSSLIPVLFQGGSGGNDRVDIGANSSAATTIDLAAKTVASTGIGLTTFSSIEGITVGNSGAGANLTVNGTAGGDAFSFSSTAPTAGRLTAPGQPSIDYSGLTNAISVDPGAGANSLTLLGTLAADTFNATLVSTLSAQRVGGAPLSAPIANLTVLGFSGDAGLDTFNMTTDPGTEANVDIDGGSPGGKKGGDTLNVILTAKGKGKNQRGGTGAGLVTVTYKPGSTPFFNYTSTETIHIVKP